VAIDPFAIATSSYVTNDDLRDRTLLIRPDRVGSRQSKTNPADTYEFVTCDVAVLSGPATDKIEGIPTILEGIQITGSALIGDLKAKIGRRDVEGQRKLSLGRIILGEKTDRSRNAPWIWDEIAEDDVRRARLFLERDQSILQLGATSDDPFA
jgi:hypothetical protein